MAKVGPEGYMPGVSASETAQLPDVNASLPAGAGVGSLSAFDDLEAGVTAPSLAAPSLGVPFGISAKDAKDLSEEGALGQPAKVYRDRAEKIKEEQRAVQEVLRAASYEKVPPDELQKLLNLVKTKDVPTLDEREWFDRKRHEYDSEYELYLQASSSCKRKYFIRSFFPGLVCAGAITLLSFANAEDMGGSKDVVIASFGVLSGICTSIASFWAWQGDSENHAATAKQYVVLAAQLEKYESKCLLGTMPFASAFQDLVDVEAGVKKDRLELKDRPRVTSKRSGPWSSDQGISIVS